MIYTFGHSNYTIEEIREILDFYSIDLVIDVRRFPTSKFPWLTRESLEERLRNKYMYLGDKLGGFREGGYEEYIKTEDFREGLEEIIALAENKRIAIMCAEKLWFRCHRRFIAQELASRGFPVAHILNFRDTLDKHFEFSPLREDFFQRDAKDVAIDLLGKLIVRKVGKRYIVGKIVETEAYFGPDDPASRAYHGKKNYNRGMWLSGGHIFVYMVHANWMFNITTDGDEAQAVLIRAVEPLVGIDLMKRNRDRKIRDLCNGPGKWTRAFGINQLFNEQPLGGTIFIADSPWKNFEIGTSKRIGVRADLEEDMRFFIRDSRFVSR